MRCIIIDDDDTARLLVKHIANKIDEVEIVADFDNAMMVLNI